MKKIIIILLVISFGYSCTETIKKKTHWEWDELKGKVESTRKISYAVKDTLGKIAKGQIMDNIYANIFIRYNDEGTWVEYRSYNPDNSNWLYEKPILDEKNNFKERYDYLFDGIDSTISRKFVYTRNESDNLTEVFCYNPSDSLLYKRTYDYDKKGRQIRMLNYATLDSLAWRVDAKFDKDDNVDEEIRFDDNNNIMDKSIFKYDKEGNNIEKSSYNSDNILEKRTTYKYNDKGHKIEICYYAANDSLENNIVFKYKYDFNDNWIERVKYVNDIPKELTERQIKYY